ncbi:EamA family transporter [Azospirillum canadense]|uniref:EamA family transporter n=1 Tax=Azospirillum canadense TaxID=403962 RepID=UPI0022276D0C|nr:EamA family transporter [Azospirillum canadense]MCW2236713.1 O-acetylserine/cysteine efflux transporter [Azospirillum canadense]
MRTSHIGLAVAVAAVWGFNFVAIKVGLKDFPPILFCVLRFVLAATPLLFLGFRQGPPVAWRYVLGIGLFLGAIQFSLLFAGINIGMPAGLSSLVLQSQAFFTALFAAVVLGDRPSARQILGMVVAFSGIGVIATEMPTGDSLLGLALLIGAAAAWGVGNILMKQAKAPDLLRLMLWVSLVPPLPLLLLSYAVEGPERMAHALTSLTLPGLAALAYIAGGATLFGFAAWGFLLRHYPASLVAPFSLLVPIFGMSSSALLLGEGFTPVKLIGALLVFGGLAVAVLKLPALRPAANKA